ncbi:MAG: zinc ribbon domain-containing protein [Halothece sp. Uz-M2-17]|nr:zinc ribbon domain-containing protein [Halothece sp. Uz-M2-17]
MNPAFTSQDCHNCGHRSKKALSTLNPQVS